MAADSLGPGRTGSLRWRATITRTAVSPAATTPSAGNPSLSNLPSLKQVSSPVVLLGFSGSLQAWQGRLWPAGLLLQFSAARSKGWCRTPLPEKAGQATSGGGAAQPRSPQEAPGRGRHVGLGGGMSLLHAIFPSPPPPSEVKELVLVPLHAAPEAAVTEIDALYDVYQDVKGRWGATVSASPGGALGPFFLQHKGGGLRTGGRVAIHTGAGQAHPTLSPDRMPSSWETSMPAASTSGWRTGPPSACAPSRTFSGSSRTRQIPR